MKYYSFDKSQIVGKNPSYLKFKSHSNYTFFLVVGGNQAYLFICFLVEELGIEPRTLCKSHS